MDKPILALQLYSLRREFEADAEDTFRKVRGLGYEYIEFAGNYGWSLDRYLEMLTETGLKVVGAHVGEHELANDLPKQVEYQKALGNDRYIIAWIPDRTVEGFKRAAALMNKAGKELQAYGGKMLYHNHDFEFAKIEGTTGYEVLLQETDPALVSFEVDTYWVEFAGMDAAEFLKTHQKRVGIIHAKEFRSSDRKDTAAGQGNIDFPSILKLAQQNSWPVVVEYEGEGAIEVCRQSAEYLAAEIKKLP